MRSRHIQVRASAEGVDVIVDDWEVFDYVDDFLTSRGLVFELTRDEEHDGQRFYVMQFGSDVQELQVTKALDDLSAEEVERIWKLNNES